MGIACSLSLSLSPLPNSDGIASSSSSSSSFFNSQANRNSRSSQTQKKWVARIRVKIRVFCSVEWFTWIRARRKAFSVSPFNPADVFINLVLGEWFLNQSWALGGGGGVGGEWWWLDSCLFLLWWFEIRVDDFGIKQQHEKRVGEGESSRDTRAPGPSDPWWSLDFLFSVHTQRGN